MKRFVLALAFFMAAPLALLGRQTAPEIPFESVPNLLKLPEDLYLGEASGVASGGPLSRRGLRCSCQFQGTYFCLLARQFFRAGLCCDGGATSGIRPRWDVHSRDWPQPVRVVVCAHGESRQV